MQSETTPFVRFLRKVTGRILRAHPQEMCRGTQFQEEARSERVANLMRLCVAFVLTVANVMWAYANELLYSTFDLIVCFVWMILALAFQILLVRRAYRPFYKYASTTADMLVAICLMSVYAVVEGPVFVFKTGLFIYVFYALGFAALRFHKNLAWYAALLAVGVLGGLWIWMHQVIGIDYGSRVEHAFGHKLNFHYAADILLYTALLGFLTILIVTNLRRQMNLRVAEAERAAREEEKVWMTAGLVHELRNPLTGIYGFSQLIRAEGSANARHVDAILEETKRMNDVVDGYLKFARPFPVRPRRVNLVELGRDFCREQTALFPVKPLRFETDVQKHFLSTDPEAIRQMLFNLVENARRHQPAGEPVRVRLEKDSPAVRFTVEDDGPGVDPKLVSRLFIPFQTFGDAGTGLGLAMTRKIAHRLGGEIHYRPRKSGTWFTLTLYPMTGGVP